MNYTATNLKDLLKQLNPKGYALNQRYINERVKRAGSHVLPMDDKEYTIGHPFRGMWIAQSNA